MEAEKFRGIDKGGKAKPEPRQQTCYGAYEPEVRVRLYVVYIIQDLSLPFY
jgi:hypothetical protein